MLGTVGCRVLHTSAAAAVGMLASVLQDLFRCSSFPMNLSAGNTWTMERRRPGQLPSKPLCSSPAKRLHSPSPCPGEASVPTGRDTAQCPKAGTLFSWRRQVVVCSIGMSKQLRELLVKARSSEFVEGSRGRMVRGHPALCCPHSSPFSAPRGICSSDLPTAECPVVCSHTALCLASFIPDLVAPALR